ncbi:MAG: PDZ domain-containing protein [Anaerolineae bacterium]|nr:PDZ domain-containing protein [Anaerolineae bacterium]
MRRMYRPVVLGWVVVVLLTAAPAFAQNDIDEEPVIVRGSFTVTNRGLWNAIAEPYVMLEDQAGFVARDRQFRFPILSQTIGPIFGDLLEAPQFAIHLPARPEGTFVDVDNDGEADAGVQVFAVAMWANTFDDPFLDSREGFGWSTALSSMRLDPEDETEVVGGIYLVWAPDDEQGFPTGFGDDGLLFTDDDPVIAISAGWNIVDMDEEPFRIWKEAEPAMTLYEGAVALKDYSDMSFTEAFEAFFTKASREYPFTELTGVDWDALHAQFAPRIAEAEANNDADAFQFAMRDLLWSIPDGHIGFRFSDAMVVQFQRGLSGGLGMVLRDLDDGRVIATFVTPDGPAAQAGIETGDEIVRFDGVPILDAVDAVQSWFGPFSSAHARRLNQLNEVVRAPIGTVVAVEYVDAGGAAHTVDVTASFELASWERGALSYGVDPWALPVEFDVLDSGVGYITVSSFSDDNNLAARVFERALRTFGANDIRGVIIDVRHNYGGESGVAAAFAGYFFDEAVTIGMSEYYNDNTGQFEVRGGPRQILPGDWMYEGRVALLVGPDCYSACEGFAYMLASTGRADLVVGMYPTNGIFGEVGRGSYALPAGFTLQIPTGRPVGLDGEIIIEGRGIEPNVWVPRTEETLIVADDEDVVLDVAVEKMLELLGR